MKKTALIVAGGSGIRMGSSIPKQFLPLAGKPIIFHTLEKFLRHDETMPIALVLHPEGKHYWGEGSQKYLSAADRSRIFLSEGGKERSSSVYNGLLHLWGHDDIPGDTFVAIHDGVRPLVSDYVIGSSFRTAALQGAAVACVPITFSIRMAEGKRSKALDRSHYHEVQTPQVFPLHEILECYNRRPHNNFTDDASLYDSFGHNIAISEGSPENIKITNPADIFIAEQMLRR